MADTVSVTQADRDGAAKLYEMFPALSSTPDAGLKTAEFIRSGGADGWTSVALFTRHRLASTQPAPAFPREEVARVLEEAFRGGRRFNDPTVWHTSADAIAALLQGKQP